MDEIFGQERICNEIVWGYRIQGVGKAFWGRKHDTILYYSKTSDYLFKAEKEDVIYEKPFIDTLVESPDMSRLTQRDKDDIIDSIRNNNPLKDKYKGLIFNKHYANVYVRDIWDCDYTKPIISGSKAYLNYPTQKPEGLLERIIKASSNPGDLIFDCFMGSGTTQAVAMKLGRRFIGADINLGSIDTTVKRLNKIASELNATIQEEQKYTGFEVYNVNNYDVFRNPIQAKDLLVEALELQPLPNNELYDGEKDGRMVKIMPVNRIATRADLNELITGFPREKFDKRKAENPNKAVEEITLVCMGHEPDLGASLKLQMKAEGYNIDVEVLDILRDKVNLEFRRDSEADVQIEGDRLVIREFFPMNLLQKLSLEKTDVGEWRELVDSIKIDFNYDGAVFTPSVIDVPEGSEFVKGSYKIPADSGTIKVKITDLLSESCEVTINA